MSIPLWVLGPSLLVRRKRTPAIRSGSNGSKADISIFCQRQEKPAKIANPN